MSGVVVNGVDLEARYGLRLTGDSEFGPPAPKSYLLDLPGGDGSLDVTEAFGDVLYENREDTMVFYAVADPGAAAFERLKTDLCRFLHGRAYDYGLPFDPGYVYHGRFSVDEAYMRMHDRRIKVKVSANPYKSAGLKVHVIDAQAGANLRLLPGRGRVRPVFESAMPCHVVAGGVDVVLPPGSTPPSASPCATARPTSTSTRAARCAAAPRRGATSKSAASHGAASRARGGTRPCTWPALPPPTRRTRSR
ncbi:MAG: hypothetical protein ACLR3C_15085 [Eggerthella lenta]